VNSLGKKVQFIKALSTVQGCRLAFYVCLIIGSILTKSFAFQVSANASYSFIEQLEDIRKLSDKDQDSAIAKLESLKPTLASHRLDDQLEYYHLLAELYSSKGLHRLTRSTAEQALVLASSLISPRIIVAKLSYDLGYALEFLGELDLALKYYLSGLEVAESLEEQKEIAIGLINLGAIYYQTNRLSDAIVAINDGLTIAENLSDLELKGFVYSELGILYGNLGETEKSIEFYNKSYRYHTEAGKPLLAMNNLRNIAIVYSGLGKYEESIATYQRLLTELKKFNNIEMMFSVYIGLARIYTTEDMRDQDLAMSYLTKTEQLLSQVEHHVLPFEFQFEKAFISKEMEQYDQALEASEKALELLKEGKIQGALTVEAMLQVMRSETYRIKGRYKDAYETYLRVYEVNMQRMQNSQTEAEGELRLQYESRRADIENSLLENKSKLESIALEEAKLNAKNKQNYIYYIGALTLIFAALLKLLMKSQRQLLYATRVDDLTQVLNRRRFTELAYRRLAKAKKKKECDALLVIDCDFFKTINDNYGHITGDNALMQLAKLGQESFSNGSIFGRFGGEEFIVLLPNHSIEQAVEKAQFYRCAVSELRWNDECEHTLTVSIGVVTTTSCDSYKFDQLFEQADELLYCAKANGRDQVCV